MADGSCPVCDQGSREAAPPPVLYATSEDTARLLGEPLGPTWVQPRMDGSVVLYNESGDRVGTVAGPLRVAQESCPQGHAFRTLSPGAECPVCAHLADSSGDQPLAAESPTSRRDTPRAKRPRKDPLFAPLTLAGVAAMVGLAVALSAQPTVPSTTAPVESVPTTTEPASTTTTVGVSRTELSAASLSLLTQVEDMLSATMVGLESTNADWEERNISFAEAMDNFQIVADASQNLAATALQLNLELAPLAADDLKTALDKAADSSTGLLDALEAPDDGSQRRLVVQITRAHYASAVRDLVTIHLTPTSGQRCAESLFALAADLVALSDKSVDAAYEQYSLGKSAQRNLRDLSDLLGTTSDILSWVGDLDLTQTGQDMLGALQQATAANRDIVHGLIRSDSVQVSRGVEAYNQAVDALPADPAANVCRAGAP